MRVLTVLLAALGIYIMAAAAPAWPSNLDPRAATLQLDTVTQAWLCPPALAITTASDDTFVWKDYKDPDTIIRPKQPLWEAALTVLLKLGFVIALIYGVLYGYKRLLGIRAAGVLGGRIRIVESTRLVGTQSLLLVEANEHYLLLGSNGAGVLVKLMEWPVAQTGPAPEAAAFAQAMTQAAAGPHGREDFDRMVESTLLQVVRRAPDGEA